MSADVNTNGPPPFDPDPRIVTYLEAGPGGAAKASRDFEKTLGCWVCEEKVSKPAHYRDRRGDVRIVHDWCIASAVTKDRRLYVEGG